MCDKKQNILLSLLIIIPVLAAVLFIVGMIVLIPEAVVESFGEPDPDLDNSSRILYSLNLFLNKKALNSPASSIESKQIFVINPGETAEEVVKDLVNAQLIKEHDVFVYYLIYKGIDRQLQAGTYALNPVSTPIEIAEALHDTTPDDISFSFLAGWRAEEIAALLPTSGLSINPDEFINFIITPPTSFSDRFMPRIVSLEGYLFPDGYQVMKTTVTEELIEQFLLNFFSHLPVDYETKLQKSNLDLNQAIILASIIEKEAILPEEAPLIASVFINRLNVGMPLQSDPTVQYALGYSDELKSWWKNPLSASDLTFISPYNTYLNIGLPPTPICNPGLNSIISVLEPADTDYLFFRAACDGSGRHIFNILYQDHLKAECK